MNNDTSIGTASHTAIPFCSSRLPATIATHLKSVVHLAFILFLLAVPCKAVQIPSNSEEFAIGEKAQEHMLNNNPVQAQILLKRGVDKYPDSDWLHSMYGRLLFSEGLLDAAEDQFQQSLAINNENIVARLLIEEVRETKKLLEDQEQEHLIEFFQDKGGDLLVIFFGVWLGTMLTSVLSWIASKVKRSQFDRALSDKDWDSVTDIIERQMVNWDKQSLRLNISKMLHVMPQDEVEDIIIRYVDHQKHENDLLFFLRKMNEKR